MSTMKSSNPQIQSLTKYCAFPHLGLRLHVHVPVPVSVSVPVLYLGWTRESLTC